MAAVSLFWNTNMAAVTSCENALLCIQLFRERLSEKVHVTIPKGNMGYDHDTVSDDCTC